MLFKFNREIVRSLLTTEHCSPIYTCEGERAAKKRALIFAGLWDLTLSIPSWQLLFCEVRDRDSAG